MIIVSMCRTIEVKVSMFRTIELKVSMCRTLYVISEDLYIDSIVSLRGTINDIVSMSFIDVMLFLCAGLSE